MKRFTKLLAMGMAIALTFGMTVSAEEGGAVDPSPVVTPAVGGSDVVISGYTPGERYEKVADARKALEEDTNLLGKFGTKLTYSIQDVFDLKVEAGKDSGEVTFGTSWRNKAEYGITWGYVLLHFTDDGVERIEMKLEDGLYRATVKSGSPFALVAWKLYEVGDWASDYDEDGNLKGTSETTFTDGITAENGQASTPYSDWAAAASARLFDDGVGVKVAQTYNSLYNWAAYKGSVKLDLTKDSYVEFSVADIDGDHAYIVVLHPVKEDGTVDFNIDVPTSAKLARIGENVYYANLPKGNWLATVYEVAIDPSLTPSSPAPVSVPGASAAAGAADATQTAGVVSPKTGEMLPVAVILAAICLAGAAVCAKKARTNA